MSSTSSTLSSAASFNAAASKGFSYLLSFGMLSKLFTFAANSLIIRNLDPETKGQIFLLEFINITIVFFSSECFRRAALREDDTSGSQEQSKQQQQEKPTIREKQVVGLGYLAIPLGLIISTLSYFVCMYYSAKKEEFANSPEKLSNFQSALVVYIIAALIEDAVQPLYILANYLMLFDVRVKIEAAALFSKVVVNIILLQVFQLPLLASSLAQIAFSLTLFISYMLWYQRNYDSKLLFSPLLEQKSIVISFYLFLQSILKNILSEGEKYVLMLFMTLKEQGVYDLVSNLGSLAARLIFQKVEEIGLTLWSKALHGGKATEGSSEHQERIETSKTFLNLILKFLIIFCSFFIFFGPSYSFTLLDILYGANWSKNSIAPSILSWYCVYVFIMAINGTLEAFVNAAFTKEQMFNYNYVMILFSVIYISINLICTNVIQLGPYSLVLANCINMLLRIIYSFSFIKTFFQKQHGEPNYRFKDFMPDTMVWAAFIISMLITRGSEWYLERQDSKLLRLLHIAIGGACCLVVLLVVRLRERNFVSQFLALVRPKRD